MEPETLRQLSGAVGLITDMVDATAREIEAAHQDIERQPYALLAQVQSIAQPVRGIEQVQTLITVGVYGAVRAINRVAGGVATSILDQFEE